MKARFRIWIENDEGKPIIGEGIEALLRAIIDTGSINQAAKELNMFYRNAWAKINKIEERLGYNLIFKKAGGNEGGGSSLTPKGQQLLQTFTIFHEESERELYRLLSEHFSNIDLT